MSRRLGALLRRALNEHLIALLVDRENANPLTHKLLARPEGERLAAIANEEAFASPALGFQLLNLAEGAVVEFAGEALQLAHLALAIAERLDETWPAAERQALRVRGRCLEAEVERLRGHLPQARDLLRRAAGPLDDLPIEGLERATYCRALGLLRREQGRDDEALALLARAVELYARLPDRRRATTCRLELGWLHLEQLETERARACFEAARRDLDRPQIAGEGAGQRRAMDDDSRRFARWLEVRHGLALCAADRRREGGARLLLREIETEAVGRPQLDQMRAEVVRAAVEQQLGDVAAAVGRLSDAWRGLLDHGAPFEALHALVDLVQLLAERGDPAGIERLHGELRAIPELTLPLREALSFGLERAAQDGLAASEILEAVRRFLRRARYDRQATFTVLAVGLEEPGDLLSPNPSSVA